MGRVWVDGLNLISGVGVIFSDIDADLVGVVGLSWSAGLADMLEETARTAADLGGGCSGVGRLREAAALSASDEEVRLAVLISGTGSGAVSVVFGFLLFGPLARLFVI